MTLTVKILISIATMLLVQFYLLVAIPPTLHNSPMYTFLLLLGCLPLLYVMSRAVFPEVVRNE